MKKSVWIERLTKGYSVRHWNPDTPASLSPDRDYFEDHNLAQKRKAELRLKLSAKQQGKIDPTISPSLCFQKYVTYMEERPDDFRPSTIQMKKESLEVYLEQIPVMSSLSPKHFSEYMIQKGYNVTTRSIRLRNFRAYCNWCWSEGYLNFNPMVITSGDGKRQKFKIPKGRETGRRLELTELASIISAMDDRALLFTLFIAYEGSRKTETLLTDWKDIDLVDNTWTIPATNCKTKRERVIPLAKGVVAKLTTTPPHERQGLLFSGFNPRTPGWYIKKACKKARVHPLVIDGKKKWPTPHDFRHSFVSHWDKDPRILMDMVGWTSLDMLKRYSHFKMAQIREGMTQTGVGAKLEGFSDVK